MLCLFLGFDSFRLLYSFYKNYSFGLDLNFLFPSSTFSSWVSFFFSFTIFFVLFLKVFFNLLLFFLFCLIYLFWIRLFFLSTCESAHLTFSRGDNLPWDVGAKMFIFFSFYRTKYKRNKKKGERQKRRKARHKKKSSEKAKYPIWKQSPCIDVTMWN